MMCHIASCYKIGEKLYENGRTLICRGHHLSKRETAVLKILKPGAATKEGMARFRREFELISRINLPGVVRAYGLEDYQGGLIMALEDIGGLSLDRLGSHHALSLKELLALLIEIVDTLEELHQQGIIHKDISPAHIILNPKTGKSKLIGFALAGKLLSGGSQPPASLEGTLAYISPEQTGRMNRNVDYRTDFYSLGATFYYLLTGKPPFEAEDALGMVHCHIAKEAIAPHSLDSDIPETISEIAMKLMAKPPEDRYQGGAALKADLERCLQGLVTSGGVPRFELGLADLPGRLLTPHRLYGREKELACLLEAFARARAGSCELVLVAGYAGVGKTALAQEMQNAALEGQGFFIKGKFDQLQRNAPYYAWLQAFDSFVNHILMENEADLAQWRLDILNAVRNNGSVLTDVIQNLELIIGPQPVLPKLGSAEAQNRFIYVFLEFVKAIATNEHPLIVFLDDLQWMDRASLRLLPHLLSKSAISNLLIIGTYRDNEVDVTHPLSNIIKELKQTPARVELITLSTLSREQISSLLADCLGCIRSDSESLTDLLYTKTEGNPFFTLQLLSALEREGLLAFDHERTRWTWDVNAIRRMGIADNVVDLTLQRVRQLPASTLNTLKRAACLGAKFDLATLSAAAEEPAEAVLAHIKLATDAQLVIASDEDYQFVHDRIQQAVYSSIPLEERAAMHWRIGMLLHHEMASQVREEHLFGIVDHLNTGASLFATPEEKAEIAEMNLRAGKRAKSRAAFATALDYFESGLHLLGEERWQDLYQLILEIAQEAVEAACISGAYDRMRKLAEIVHLHAACLLDEVPTYETEIRALTAQGQLLSAIRLGLNVLNRLGMPLSEEPSAAEVEEHMKRSFDLLEERTIEGLYRLPPMTSPDQLACTSILSELGEPAYAASPQFFLVWASVMAEISLRYGNCALTPFAYAAYALALCATGTHVETGSSLAKAAIAMLKPLGAQALRCRLLNIYGCTIQPWTEHIRTTLPTLQSAIDAASESGDFTSGSYAAFNTCTAAFFMGEPLEQLTSRLQQNMNVISGMNQTYIYNWVAFHLLTVLRLRGITDLPRELDSFDEAQWLVSARSANDQCGLAYYFLNKLITTCLLGEAEFGQALEYLAEVKANQAGFQAAFAVPISYFYGSLTLLKHSVRINSPALEEVRENLSKLEGLARLAPMNFQHKCDLIGAELARIEGKEWEAAKLYEKAITGARENGFFREEALSCELAGAFYLGCGMESAGRSHLRSAYEGYVRWTAWEKVRTLVAKHPDWLPSRVSLSPAPETRGSTENLDLDTVLKASHAISSEMEMNRLLSEVMRIVIENAGAQTGVLFFEKDGLWLATAKGRIGTSEIEIPQPVDVDEGDEASAGVIRFVARTREPVVIDDAAKQGGFVNDPYIKRHKPKSLLCLPLLSRGQLIGVLYLENGLSAGAFTPEKVRLIEMLLSQAAISLENARIYEALRSSEAKYRHFVDTANEGIWVLGPDALTTFINARMAEILGYNVEEIVRRPVTDFMFEEDMPDHLRRMERRRRGLPEHYERRFRHRNGHPLWTLASATPIFDEKHQFGGSFAMFTDITERKLAEQKVFLMNFALDNVREAAFLIDEEGRFRFVNEESCRILGYTREQLLGMRVSDVDPDMSMDRWPEHWRDLQARQSLLFEGRHKTRDGRLLPMEINANYFEYDKVGYNLALARDISERRRTEQELRQYRDQLEETVKKRTSELHLARDAAEAANKAKSVFLANMSHELRTPLNAILGFSTLLYREPGLNDSQREKLDIINRSGDHLLTLINDVLEMAKIEAGRIQVENAPFDLIAMVRGIVDLMRLRAQEKGLFLRLDQSTALPPYIRGDEARLRQVLINLVGNAVKFTQEGGISIRLRVKRNTHSHLRIEVEDTGPGINAENQKRLFQPFQQLAEGEKQAGTGLGLVISRQYMSLMGGTISLESTPGKGTIFRIDLPVELATETEVSGQPVIPAPGEVAGLATKHSGKAYRVLIAEDHYENRLLLSNLMTDLGLEVIEAENGEQCLKRFQESHPHLIWMDRLMPGMDGVEAAARIRQLPGGRDVKIVAVTASVFKEQQQEILAAGMDDIVCKPYRFNEIYNCLTRQLGLQYAYRPGSTNIGEETALPVLTPVMLDVLPGALRDDFRNALERLDSESIDAVIGEIHEVDADLARTLLRYTANFDYQTILDGLAGTA